MNSTCWRRVYLSCLNLYLPRNPRSSKTVAWTHSGEASQASRNSGWIWLKLFFFSIAVYPEKNCSHQQSKRYALPCHWVVKPVSWSQKHWIGRCASSRYKYMFMISEWRPRCTCNFFRRPQPDVAAKVWICREMLIGESNIPRLADLAKLSNRVICAQQLLRWSRHYISAILAQDTLASCNRFQIIPSWLEHQPDTTSVRECTIEAKVLVLDQHCLVVDIICMM